MLFSSLEFLVLFMPLALVVALRLRGQPLLDGEPLARVEVKALFKLAPYVLARRALAGEIVLFDHLFTYFK